MTGSAERMEIVDFETPTLNEKGQIIAQTRHLARRIREDLGNGVSLDLIEIPAGAFQMGSPPHQGNPDEHPQHFVRIKPFLMSQGLITQRQWKAVLGKLPPCRFRGDNLPVERVSWEATQRLCQHLSTKTGRNYQLPSETQWEYACRAGTNTPFSVGDTLTTQFANFNGEHSFDEEARGIYRHAPSEPGTFPPNAFGLYDMHGNLWEWCADSWLDDYFSSPRDGSSYQNRDSRYRVGRGGSWHEPPELCRSATRLRVLQSEADEFMGVRVVCDVPERDK